MDREKNRELLREGILIQKEIREAVSESVPVWPRGFNSADSDWYVYGAKCEDCIYLGIWRCSSTISEENSISDSKCSVCMEEQIEKAELLYPACLGEMIRIEDISGHKICCRIPEGGLAALIKLTIAS